MNISLPELQRQIQRGPALVVGPGMTTTRGREAELLKVLREAFPIPGTDSSYSSYLDYADAIIASNIASECALRKRVFGEFRG